MKKVTLLKFIGFQRVPGMEPMKLYNLITSPCPERHPVNSTVGILTLKKMGVISWGLKVSAMTSDLWPQWVWLSLYQAKGWQREDSNG